MGSIPMITNKQINMYSNNKLNMLKLELKIESMHDKGTI